MNDIQRDISLDFMKGVLIYLVVLGHILPGRGLHGVVAAERGTCGVASGSRLEHSLDGPVVQHAETDGDVPEHRFGGSLQRPHLSG